MTDKYSDKQMFEYIMEVNKLLPGGILSTHPRLRRLRLLQKLFRWFVLFLISPVIIIAFIFGMGGNIIQSGGYYLSRVGYHLSFVIKSCFNRLYFSGLGIYLDSLIRDYVVDQMMRDGLVAEEKYD